MLRIGYPLDSHVTYKTDGTPVWDRAISSAPYRKLIKSLFSDGVLPNPSTNLQVSAGTGMKVNLYAGFAICNGCQKLQETNMSLDIATASAVNDRIDTVILRLNDNDDVRECEFYVLTGTPAVSPVRPALTQTDSIWEIGLADVLVKANSTQISNANITDTRYETARCGIISSISEFDTTTLYQQVQADLQEFRDINQAEFIAWVDSLENKLSGDVAGNLQLQIDELNDFVDHGSLYSTNTETFKDLESGFYRLRNYKSDLFPGSAAVIGTMQKNVVGGHHTGTIITTDGVNYTRFADYDSSGALVSDTGWKKMSVDTLTTMEQVEASTDDSKAVGAGAVKELSNSLGKCELLCYATSTGNISVQDLTKYKAVVALLHIDGNIYTTSLIPLSLFKTITRSRCSYYDSSGIYNCDFKYVDDTTINVLLLSNSTRCYFYGI